jgi:hypothetical protein
MPCSDGGYAEQLRKEELNRKINKLEAMLCGLNNFLLKKGLQVEAITHLRVHSQVDFQSWVIEHNKKDFERVKAKMARSFSSDEMELIKQMMKRDD